MENPSGSQGQCLQTQPGPDPGLPPRPAPSRLSQRLALHRDPQRHPRAAETRSWRGKQLGSVRDYVVQLTHLIDE